MVPCQSQGNRGKTSEKRVKTESAFPGQKSNQNFRIINLMEDQENPRGEVREQKELLKHTETSRSRKEGKMRGGSRGKREKPVEEIIGKKEGI